MFGQDRYLTIVANDIGPHAKCRYCAIVYTNCLDDESLVNYPIPESHAAIELTSEGYYKLQEMSYIVEREGKEEIVTNPKELCDTEIIISSNVRFAISLDKQSKKLADREKVEVPIEIEGPNGKEIIGYEQKPVSIVIEREKSEKQPEVNPQ